LVSYWLTKNPRRTLPKESCRYRLEQRTATLQTRMRMLRRWYLFMRICFLIQIHLYIYLVYIQYIIIMAESWFEFCARFSLVYFHFCLAASQDTAKFVCPLYMFIGGALLTPSPAPFPIVFMSLYFLFLGLKNFASFSPVWLQLKSKTLVVGQSRRSSFSSIIIYSEPLYFIYNTIQCGDCHRVVEQNRVKVFSATYIKWKHCIAFLMMQCL
jgi:hypothetical protein